jgi:hypothetical protein
MYICICPTSYSTESPQNEVATPWTKARRCERTSGRARTFLRGSPWGAPGNWVSHQGFWWWIRSWTKTLWFFEGKLRIMTTWYIIIYIICIYNYIYIICIYICICCMCIYICMYIYMYACCICIYIHCIYVCTSMYKNMYIYICMSTYIYIRMYVYIVLHGIPPVHIYIYIYL